MKRLNPQILLLYDGYGIKKYILEYDSQLLVKYYQLTLNGQYAEGTERQLFQPSPPDLLQLKRQFE